ncbi:MAG TPA: tetratricopeptide repeat protein [Rhizomicrobium sp.]|nr:tetratricopeptide repeat protein [Rhizomicrobium sp.]
MPERPRIAVRDDSARLFDTAKAHQAAARLPQALAIFDTLLLRHPSVPELHVSRAQIHLQCRRFEEALAAAERAMALAPDDAEVKNLHGLILTSLGRHEAAQQSFERALAFAPDHAGIHNDKGLGLQQAGRPLEALAEFDRAAALQPDCGDWIVNKGMSLLSLGRFSEGWPLYETRMRRAAHPVLLPGDGPRWTGQDIAGKTLLLCAEQGYGDTIQFCRYARLAVARGARVILAVPDRLTRLLRSLGGSVQIVDQKSAVPSCDYRALLLSLPHIFRTQLDNVPGSVPYLHPEPERTTAWARRIGGEGFRIGIAWQGDRRLDVDIGRSPPLALFAALAEVPGVRLISLQKFDGLDQLQGLPPDMPVEILEDFDSGPDGFVDTAAVMANLDLVITSDTAIAHLAGALARPTWVVLKHVPDWRWLLEREDTPWYPGMRLFRQPAPGDWHSVFAAMHAQLGSAVRARPAATLPGF